MKKLIYFTISNNIEYLTLLKMCIKSLNRFDYDGDILFIRISQVLPTVNIRLTPFQLQYDTYIMVFDCIKIAIFLHVYYISQLCFRWRQ